MNLRDYFTRNGVGESILTGVRLEALAEGRRQHFNDRLVEKYKSRSMLSVVGDDLIMHTVDGDMVFHIDHPPTRVCLHCGEYLPNEDREEGGELIPQGDSRLGAGARKHVAEKHEGEESPDPQFLSGYKYKKYYGCTPDTSIPDVNPKAKGGLLSRLNK